MSTFCQLGGSCKDSSLIYGLVDDNANKLHKLSFSKSLINHIVNTTTGYKQATFEFKLGERLQPGQTSKSGLYGIMSAHKRMLLRVQIDPNMAQQLTPDSNRYLTTVWLNR